MFLFNIYGSYRSFKTNITFMEYVIWLRYVDSVPKDKMNYPKKAEFGERLKSLRFYVTRLSFSKGFLQFIRPHMLRIPTWHDARRLMSLSWAKKCPNIAKTSTRIREIRQCYRLYSTWSAIVVLMMKRCANKYSACDDDTNFDLFNLGQILPLNWFIINKNDMKNKQNRRDYHSFCKILSNRFNLSFYSK